MGFVCVVLAKILLYSLAAYYGVITAFGICLLFLTKAKSKFWKVKKRPYPPQCLLDKELGEHKIATVNGIQLHYVQKGDKSKPLMLFVHGFPEFWYSWRHQIKEFSKDYWVVAVDMRGYAESDKPKGVSNYSLDLLVSDLRELLTHLGRNKCIMVAHDWGSLIAFHYILKHMETIERYICMDAPSSEALGKRMTRSWSQFRKSWYMFFFQVPFLPEFTFSMFDFKGFQKSMTYKSENVTQEDLEAYKYVFSKKDSISGPINYYRANVLSFLTGEGVPPNPRDFAPGLYLHGERDLFISDKFVKILPKMYPNLEAKSVPRANHFAQQDQPEEVNRLIREFLRKK